MGVNGKYDHTFEEATDRSYRYSCSSNSENIIRVPHEDIRGATPAAVAENFVVLWSKSDAHRKAMIDPEAHSMGAGVYVSEEYVYATQAFCRSEIDRR